MSHLVVQLWGIGNLVQTEPLLRYLGKGDLLIDPRRGTWEIARLFPGWNFLATPRGFYDDVWICGPWIPASHFQGMARRVHTPVWTFQGRWEETEASVLLDMAAGRERENTRPRLDPEVNERRRAIVLSNGYNTCEPGWEFKSWGQESLGEAIDLLLAREFEVCLVGLPNEWRFVRDETTDWTDLSLMEQLTCAATCMGYLGNDTGWAHLLGAIRGEYPGSVFVRDPSRQDPVKNRPGLDPLWQFGPEVKPSRVTDWLIRQVEAVHGRQEEAGTTLR